MNFTHYRLRLRMVANACKILSSLPDLIIANSRAGIEAHRAVGYRPRRAEVVPNGIDVEQFKPKPAARHEVRAELGLPNDAIVLAHVARVDPMKDHTTFLAAMAQLPDIHALLIGSGTEQLPETTNCHRLGLRSDVPRLLNAADFVVSSSAFGEGFSNVLAEGMACGLPAITTDVGDASLIVGETGVLVPPRQPALLVAGIRKLANEQAEARQNRSSRARARIVDNFSLAKSVAHYDEIYMQLLIENSFYPSGE